MSASSNLYKEALNEAKGLVQMAEENAKNKIIEAFTPKIRQLVEKSIMSEEDFSLEDLIPSDISFEDEVISNDEEVFEDSYIMDDILIDPVQDVQSDETDDKSIDLKIPQGIKSVELDIDDEHFEDDEDSFELTAESVETLLKIVDGQGTLFDRARQLRLELKILGRALNTLKESRSSKVAFRIVEEFNGILRKAIGLKQELNELASGPNAKSAKAEFITLLEEIENMSTRTLLRSLLAESKGRRLNEEEELDMDMDVDMELDDADVDADDAEVEVEVDVDAIKDAVEDLADAVGLEVEDHDDMDDLVDMDDDMDDEVMETRERVFTIDESMLRRELRRLRSRRMREAVEDSLDQFGDGEDEGDLLEDPPELNMHDDELGVVSEQRRRARKTLAEARRLKQQVIKEARANRALRAQLEVAAGAVKKLNRQLSEQKLFNAKLMFVNKLMQNKGLSDKQLKSVVEALDAAKTIREAKLLYTSLSESLSRQGGSLTESSARSAGGSSRPTRSGGAPLNEAVELDRWATLAGIK